MTSFRYAVRTNTRLDIGREHGTACSSGGQNPKKEPGFNGTAYRRYVP